MKLKTTRQEMHEIYDIKTLCDICKNEQQNGRREDSEVKIQCFLGNIWPEGDFREVTEMDCCTDCFYEKVKPLIEKELGVVFRQRDAEDREHRYAEETK